MRKYDLAYYVTVFFTSYLPGIQNLKENSILSYRDAFSKLLLFFKNEKGISPDKLKVTHLGKKPVHEFLLWLVRENGCSPATANQRLSTLRSFASFLQIEAPEHMQLCSDILSIKRMKTAKPVVKYLSRDGVKVLLARPDTTSWQGRRDLAMLSVLYDSGARVQELCDLTMRDVRTASPMTLHLTGKGGKSRFVSLVKPNADILSAYISERGLNKPEHIDSPLFANRQGGKLSRGGVAYILKKYVNLANIETPHFLPQKLTPHSLRHSKAMHLLESGTNLIYIRDFLGHEDVETTQVYAKANPEVKRKAIENAYKDDTTPTLPDWQSNPKLMDFLRSLGN